MDIFVIYNDANNCPGRSQAPCDPPLRFSSGWPIDFLWGNFFCQSSGPHSSGIYNDAQHVIGPAQPPGDPTSWFELHFLIFKIQASRIRFGPFAMSRALFRTKPRSTVCVCVWNIWTDVKLLLVFLFAGGQWISFHPLPNEDGGFRLWYQPGTLGWRTCTFIRYGTRLSPEPHPRLFRLRVRLPQSELITNLFYWFELQSISECWTPDGYFRSGPYSTLHTFIQGILMVTSRRTL